MQVSDQDNVYWKRNIYPVFVLKWQTVRISCRLLLDENLFLFGHWGKNRPEYLCIVIFLFCILAKATVQNLIFKTLEYWSTYYSEYSPQKHMSSCSQLPPVTSIFFCPFLKVVSAIVPIIILVFVSSWSLFLLVLLNRSFISFLFFLDFGSASSLLGWHIVVQCQLRFSYFSDISCYPVPILCLG